MPANLSPEYKAAESNFRKARDPKERLEWLREMLRVIPKHKGTDHLQGDIRRRIRELSEELEGHKKGGARGGPTVVTRPEGAAQIALLGPPNSGKSSLHVCLTASNAHVGPYPFTTRYPEPGMMPFEDIRFQLVDLPAIAPEHPVPWIADALQTADGGLLVVDLSDPACVEQVQALHEVLRERHVVLSERWEPACGLFESDDDVFEVRLPTLLLDNKSDRVGDPEDDLEVFRELTGLNYPALAVSAATGHGLGDVGSFLFRNLRIVRVYTKTPGHSPDRQRPFTLRRGQTVQDVARLIHKDLERAVRYARVWGKSGFEGQQVGREHAVEDGDVVELHT
ncbi:MAG TPA: TGS domain-containing protein [Candidatus Binatia bacterium]|nr:TGS domain-containing protein [Candidatus Binatia bacterium]